MAQEPESTILYLGDGVYASFDGYQIWLSTQREIGQHIIALDPFVLERLVEYAKKYGFKMGQ